MLPQYKLKLPKSFKFTQNGQGIIEIIVVIGIATIILLALVSLSTRANKSSTTSANADQAARLAQEGIEIINTIKAVGGSRSPGDATLQYFNCDGTYALSSNDPLTGRKDFMSWATFYNLVDVDDQQSASYCRSGNNSTAILYDDKVRVTNFGVNWGYIDPVYGRQAVLHPPPVEPTWSLHIAEDKGAYFFGSNEFPTPTTTNFIRSIFIADTPPSLGGKSHCNTDNSADANYGLDYQTVKQFTVVVGWDDSSGHHQSVATSCITRDQ